MRFRLVPAAELEMFSHTIGNIIRLPVGWDQNNQSDVHVKNVIRAFARRDPKRNYPDILPRNAITGHPMAPCPQH